MGTKPCRGGWRWRGGLGRLIWQWGGRYIGGPFPTGVRQAEGLTAFRVLMLLSSLSPLFILWATRGTTLIPDKWFISACAILVVCPFAVLFWRFERARANREKRQLAIGRYEDSRKHLLVYLFATLLPFYRTTIVEYRDFAAMILALGFIGFLFWHLRLYYINIFFAFAGYRIFTIHSPEDDNAYTGREPIALVSTRHTLPDGGHIIAHRITATVYWEPRNEP